MPEPSTSAASAAGYAAVKGFTAIGGAAGLGAGLAALVVMASRPPRSAREWVVGITTTVVGSIGGGSALVQWLGINGWAHDGAIGMAALMGLSFACGLPAWFLVRAVFNTTAKHEASTLGELADEIRGVRAAVERREPELYGSQGPHYSRNSDEGQP